MSDKEQGDTENVDPGHDEGRYEPDDAADAQKADPAITQEERHESGGSGDDGD